jgi:hypothetical protein
VFEEARDDVCLACFLLEIHDTFKVGTVFGFVGCGGERDVDVFTSDPLVKVILDLRKKKALGNIFREFKTYHRLHESDGSHWKYIILGKLRVYSAVILFIFEPDLIDESLYKRGAEYACFR